MDADQVTAVSYSVRIFTAAEIQTIRQIIAERDRYPTTAAISRAVCAALDWRQSNGNLKEVSCRVLLNRVHEDGLICLPPPLCSPPRANPRFTAASNPRKPISGSLGDLKDIELRRVTTKSQSRLWNELIARYHYLGYKPLVGAQLRYLVYDEGRLLAAFGFGAAAWKVAPRDRFIG